MKQNEPNANLRKLVMTLYDAAGNPLDGATSWSSGLTKISKGGGAFSNTTNLPAGMGGGAENSFLLQLTVDEVNTLGPIVVQVFDVGGALLAEFGDAVVDSAEGGSGVIRSGTAQDGGAQSIVLDEDASSVNDSYKNAIVVITAGAGAGQINQIIGGYNGTTKNAPLAEPWPTSQPDSSSEFTLLAGGSPAAFSNEVLENSDVEGGLSLADITRVNFAILAGKADDFETDTTQWRSPISDVVRWTNTYSTHGRITSTQGNVDP